MSKIIIPVASSAPQVPSRCLAGDRDAEDATIGVYSSRTQVREGNFFGNLQGPEDRGRAAILVEEPEHTTF